MTLKAFHTCLPEELFQRLQAKADADKKSIDEIVVELLEYALKNKDITGDGHFLNAVQAGFRPPLWED
jgi:hypothetical protein